MINKSNDLPSFVNETNLPNIVDKLTDAKNIKISNNKYGNRVQTVIDKIVEKADDITKAIKQEVINDSYSFKVGTGDVDVSADVEDGFGEVGVKGVTYQNIFNNFSMSGEASKYITVNENTIKWTKSAVTTSNINIKYHNSLAQLDKTYTLVFYIYKNTLQKEGIEDSYNVAKFNIVSYNSGVYFIPVNKTGLVKVKLIQPTTTPSDGKPYLEVYKDMVGELEISYPILLEGDYTNDDKIPSQFEGIVGVGDKSKNLFNYKLHDSIEYNGSYFMVIKERWRSNVVEYTVEPNTDYTISVDRYEGNLWFNFEVDGVQFNNNNYSKFSKVVRTNETGKLLLRVGANGSADVGHKFINLQLEKGTVATQYEPHYDGHKIEILSCGKNLVNPIIPFPYNIKKNEYNDGALLSVVKVKPNTTYTMSVDRTDEKGRIVAKFSNRLIQASELSGGIYSQSSVYNFLRDNYANGRKFEYTIHAGSEITFTTLDDCNFIYLNTDGAYGGDFNTGDYVTTINNVQIEESPTPTSFQSYQEDKTQILLDEPLMRLPNGVCDEITRDGKLIRRVGKIVFTGIESWNLSKTSDKTILFEVGVSNIKIDKKGDILPICDKLLASLQSNIWVNDIEGVSYTDNNSNRFRIRINKNRLDTQDLTGFKKWLSQNPVTVYYELAEPVITELPAPCLRIFKDGHLTFNTLVAPESNHVVQLNKSAQIERSIREVQGLDNRINVLENNYDNLMLSTISRLNDLELNYKLK